MLRPVVRHLELGGGADRVSVIATLGPETAQARLDLMQEDGDGSLSRFDNILYGAAPGVDGPLSSSTRIGLMLGGLGGNSSLSSGYGNTGSRMIFGGP